MDETEHTPGPWTIKQTIGSLAVIDKRYLPICEVAARPARDAGRQMKANARLITAAPDLYALVLQLAHNMTPSETVQFFGGGDGTWGDIWEDNLEGAIMDARTLLSQIDGTD